MAQIYPEPSRTFSEYLLVPNLTTKQCVPENVDLSVPLVRYREGEAHLRLNIPYASAIMQAVSDDTLAIALARCGGIAFLYSSQTIEEQAAMVRRVKNFKAGFVTSAANLRPDDTLASVVRTTERTGHSTIPITHDGTAHGRLEGILTGRDFRPHKANLNRRISEVMTPFDRMVCGREGQTLSEANELIWEHKLNCLPIIDENRNLRSLVFRKDYDEHKQNPEELIDAEKRLVVGAGINTRDARERVPALVEAGVDVMCIDSSDGYSEWQAETIDYVKSEFGAKVGAGNIVDEEAFRYLADARADFVKIGIGPGSICITREQKGIGRGQASAVMEIARARQEYLQRTGEYVPLCADGGMIHDYHVVLALAMGADFTMHGRYFARFDETPGRKLWVRGRIMKEYWGEGSNRARNWQRYEMGGGNALLFEEGVDAYVPYAGRLRDNLAASVYKVRSTMCNCGALSVGELQEKARITPVSGTSIREGGAHDVLLKESDIQLEK